MIKAKRRRSRKEEGEEAVGSARGGWKEAVETPPRLAQLRRRKQTGASQELLEEKWTERGISERDEG